MSTDVLEKPARVRETPRETSKSGSIVVTEAADCSVRSAPQKFANASEREPLSQRPRIEVLLREIFEGREEFLGWTPD